MILAVSVCAMTIFGYRLREIHLTYHIGDEIYKELTGLVRPGGLPVLRGPQEAADPERPGESGLNEIENPERNTEVKIPYMFIDFETLRAINPDAAAWLYGPGTEIDYPVMRASDYNYYLRHLPDGTYNVNGTLFIDYNWTDFSDQLTIIYGHNMKSEKMFGSLTNYKKQAYFDDNPYLYLYTAESGNYRIELMYGCIIGAGQWRERAFMFDLNLDALLAYADYNTTFTSQVQYNPGDKIIVLSTCSYEFDDARYIVVGVLRPE